MTGLTIEERNIALEYARNGADFMFIPSVWLCNMMSQGSPETIDINPTILSIMLTREPIRLDTATVVKYCRGTLDSKNTWLLDHGDIILVPHRLKKLELVKNKEENNLEENEDE